MTRGTQAVCAFSWASVHTLAILAIPLSAHSQSSNHPALSLRSSGSATFLLSNDCFTLHLKTLTISCSFPPSWAWRQSFRELQWLPTTPSTQISASVPQLAAFCPFLEGNSPWSRGRLLSEDHHPHEPLWIPCCPCRRPTFLLPQHSPLRCSSWKRCLPQMFPWLPIFLPSAVCSVTLFVNSSWSSCSNLRSPASYFLFPYSTLLFSLARTTV